MYNDVKNEPPITDDSILEEILPLLKDYFIGEFHLSKKRITYILPNGQKFIIISAPLI